MESEVSEVRKALYRGDRTAAEALAASRAQLNAFDAGADPNAEQQGGFRPLDEALLTENSPLADLLRERGGTVSGNPLPG